MAIALMHRLNQRSDWIQGYCASAMAALFLLASPPAGRAGENHPAAILTSVRAVKDLTPEEVRAAPTVQLEAVVTYYDAGSHFLFVQDETSGIYVRTGSEDLRLRPGDVVLLDGIAGQGRLNNVIDEPACAMKGRARLPRPKVLAAADVMNPATDGERVQVTGVLRSISEERGRLIYYLGVGNDRLKVTINTLARGTTVKHAGRTITVSGVHYGILNDKGERTGMGLLVDSMRSVTVEKSEEPGLYDLPVTQARDVQSFAPGKMARLQILVDKYDPRGWLEGHDATGTIGLRTSQQDAVKSNAVVDAAGYVVHTSQGVVLQDAYFIRIGFGNVRSFAPREELAPLRLIESAGEVRRLSGAEARRGYPVRLRGVVTYYEPQWSLCFIQGASEGVFVDTHHQPLDIETGQLVIVSGHTAEGDFAPVVRRPKFEVIGNAPMPAERQVAYTNLLTGSEDSQWLTLECVVRSVVENGPVYELDVVPTDSTGGSAKVYLSKASASEIPQELDDMEVELDAVCATQFDEARRMNGVKFFCPGFRHVRAVGPSKADPFARAVTPIDAAFQFRANTLDHHRIHVLGNVTWADGRGAFFVQDLTGGIRVQSGAPVTVGQRVNVVGYRTIENGQVALRGALVREGGAGDAGQPESISAARALSEASRLDGRLVQLSGRVIELRRTALGADLLLQNDASVFLASLTSDLPVPISLPAGSTVKVSGVATFTRDSHFDVRNMQVLLRSWDDLQVLGLPPGWTLQRLTVALGIVAAIGVAALLWVIVLRRQVARHKAVLDTNLETQRALQAKVAEAQKMDCIGNLAGGIAHDFNNILMIILGYVDVMAQEKLSSFVAEAVSEISGAAHRAADLTRQLLLFSRKQVPRPSTLDITQTVRDVARMLGRILGEDIALRCTLPSESVYVNGDKGMIEQVLMNLAVNSRDAMPRGGALAITVKKISGDGAPGSNEQDRPGVRIIVTDTGVGIPEQDLPRIFDPFFTTKEVGKGTGLGLATVYGIVQQHQGSISVQSTVASGTTFSVWLPTAEPPASASADRESSQSTPADATILLVEDDAGVRRLNREILTKAGYSVIEADSGPAALSVTSDHPAVDLLLTDVVMPGGMSGTDLAEKILERYPGIPVILTSGYSEFHGRPVSLPQGAAFLHKPYPPETLVRTVASALESKIAKAA